ncbi:MAG TPA: RNA-guided pseudouridylation complex pseudouridine synthase subunit Cbf5 [Thermoplasmata archaeon]|nr:RNA-guided pseudouridylation complex pseudouridine synthase subunit Cbf5 [Thermoplasmata archaeon]
MSAPEPAPATFPPAVAERLRAGAFLLVDKPRGPSSHQVTAWVRDLLGLDRAGHAGTLDPGVSGLLWIGVGPALKLIPLTLEFPKRYVGVIDFHAAVAPRELDRVVREFTGPIFQTPPVRSAVRRERRVRTVHRLEVLERTPTTALVDVVADSGTYVRTLAVDLGDALGVGAQLAELRRTGTGPFREEAAIRLADLADRVHAARAGSPDGLLAALHPVEEVTREFPAIELKDGAAAAIAHGASLARGGVGRPPPTFAAGASVVLVDRAGRLVAVGRALVPSTDLGGRRPGWVIATTRVFADPARYPPRWRTGATRAEPAATG